MLTQNQVRLIQSEKVTLSQKYIHDFNRRWEEATGRLKRSGHNLNNITIVPARNDE